MQAVCCRPYKTYEGLDPVELMTILVEAVTTVVTAAVEISLVLIANLAAATVATTVTVQWETQWRTLFLGDDNNKPDYNGYGNSKNDNNKQQYGKHRFDNPQY